MLAQAPSEHPLVEAVWYGIQLSTAAALCCHWLAAGRGPQPAADLLGGLQLDEKVWRLSATAGGGPAVRIVGRLVAAGASTEGFGALLPTLGSMLGSALSAQGQQAQQAVAAVQRAAGEAVTACLRGDGSGGGGGVQLAGLLAGLSLQEPTAAGQAAAPSPAAAAAAPIPTAAAAAAAGGGGEAAYAALCAWLELILLQLSSSPTIPEGLLFALDRLTQAAYYLLAPPAAAGAAGGQPAAAGSGAKAQEERLWLLASCLGQLAGRVGEARCMTLQQRLFALSSAPGPAPGHGGGAEPDGRRSWLPLLACWLLDALALRAPLAAAGAGRDAALGLLLHAEHGGLAPSDRGVEEALQIQEAALGAGAAPAAVPLWSEFFLRYQQYRSVLSALVSREDLLIALSTLSQHYYHAAPALAAALSHLSGAAQGTVAPRLVPFLGDPAGPAELGRVHAGWAGWAAAAAAQPVAGSPAPIQPVAAGTAAGLAGVLAPAQPAPAEEGGLAERFASLEEKLDEVEGLLRFWARRWARPQLLFALLLWAGSGLGLATAGWALV